MIFSRRFLGAAALAAGLGLAFAGAALAKADPSPSLAATTAPPSLRPNRRDAAFVLAAAGLTALVATRDRAWLAQATDNHTRFALDLAADAKRMGDPVSMGVPLLLADLASRAFHAQPVAAASERIAASCAAAGVVSLLIKEAAGRERPDETADPGRFKPFSGRDAFPSGHSTVAFAFAASLDAETGARWVPMLAYPAAALTAWSRVRDRRHWPSDVVAGAAVGAGVAWRADAYARARWPLGLVLVPILPQAGGSGMGASVLVRF